MTPPALPDRGEKAASLLDSFSDKHGQMDIRIDKVSVSVPGTPIGLEVNGLVTVSFHMRDLTDEERKAHIARTVATIRGR